MIATVTLSLLKKNVPVIGAGRDPERTPVQWDTSEQPVAHQFLPNHGRFREALLP